MPPRAKKVTPKTRPTKKVSPKKTSPQKQTVAEDGWPEFDYVNMCLYGDSRTGKTTVWGSFPGPMEAVFCRGSAGELRSINTPEHRKKIRPRFIEDINDFDAIIEEQENNPSVVSFVVDNLTNLQQLVLAGVVGKKVPEQLSWGFASQQQWGQVGYQLKETLRRVLDLPCNSILVAHQRDFDNKNEGGTTELELLPTVGPALSPGTASWLTQAVDYIGQTFIRPKYVETVMEVAGEKITSREPVPGEVEYCLRANPDPVYMTKFRKVKGIDYPSVIVDPDYDKIMEIINAGA